MHDLIQLVSVIKQFLKTSIGVSTANFNATTVAFAPISYDCFYTILYKQHFKCSLLDRYTWALCVFL
jgi:hypothetical protein